jgi:hypothetical protein
VRFMVLAGSDETRNAWGLPSAAPNLLDGEDFVFLPSHDANRISICAFWRTLTYDDVRNHEIRLYQRGFRTR